MPDLPNYNTYYIRNTNIVMSQCVLQLNKYIKLIVYNYTEMTIMETTHNL